jgi:hypothetical protein
MKARLAFALLPLLAASAHAATLPAHDPLRILIVSDQVNPHNLVDADLTQPGDISATLARVGTGIGIDAAPGSLVEIATDDLDQATALLSVPFDSAGAYDVLIYFSHRLPNTANAVAAQNAFTAAVDAFLTVGGGLVSFHHGSYFASGKEGILALIGGQANGAVPYDAQNVIAVAPMHFVASNSVVYTGSVMYADAARGVAAGSYPFFNNTPDERYPNFQLTAPAAELQLLFASDYNDLGTTHVLGFVHRRAAWQGVVVAYQPGEYQPHALDDLDGNNFQILANAIWFSRYHLALERIFGDGFE